MGYRIRQYRDGDFPQLSGLLTEVYQSPVDQKTLETHYLSDRHFIILAEDQETGRIAGCTFIERKQDYIRPGVILYVTYVAVSEACRKQGIGKALLAEVERMCHDLGATAIELTSANFRTAAHAFYESIGYTKKKTTVFIKEIPQE